MRLEISRTILSFMQNRYIGKLLSLCIFLQEYILCREVVVHACNPRGRRSNGSFEFQASPGYIETCLKKREEKTLLRKYRHLGRCSVVKSTYLCSSRTPQFSSQHPCWMVYNLLELHLHLLGLTSGLSVFLKYWKQIGADGCGGTNLWFRHWEAEAGESQGYTSEFQTIRDYTDDTVKGKDFSRCRLWLTPKHEKEFTSLLQLRQTAFLCYFFVCVRFSTFIVVLCLFFPLFWTYRCTFMGCVFLFCCCYLEKKYSDCPFRKLIFLFSGKIPSTP